MSMLETNLVISEEKVPPADQLQTYSAKFRCIDVDQQCDPARLYDASIDALSRVTAGDIRECSHRFSPQGYSLILSAPGLFWAVHTWPELGVLTVDVVSADSKLASQLIQHLQNVFGWKAA